MELCELCHSPLEGTETLSVAEISHNLGIATRVARDLLLISSNVNTLV